VLRFRWKCKLCKRSFSGEEYLDLHLKKKHPEVWSEVAINLRAFMFSRVVPCLCSCVRLCACVPNVNVQTGSVCLGDYCDILRCHEYQEKAPIGAASTGCTPATLEKRKFECKVRNYMLVTRIAQSTGLNTIRHATHATRDTRDTRHMAFNCRA
jgi:hypothetical protein